MGDTEVKQRTGFSSMSKLLAFVILVCEGRIDLISKRFTLLTWLKEWFFYFEFVWQRSIANWWQVTNVYGPWHSEMRPLFVLKLGLVKQAQQRWPR